MEFGILATSTIEFQDRNAYQLVASSRDVHEIETKRPEHMQDQDREQEQEKEQYHENVDPVKDSCERVTVERREQAQKHYREPKQEKVQEDAEKLLSAALKVKLPYLSGQFNNEKTHDDDDGGGGGDYGCKTPTYSDQKLPVIPKCHPPAPRKQKSKPSRKLKVGFSTRSILLDLSKEVESLFPPHLLADLGNNIKKARH